MGLSNLQPVLLTANSRGAKGPELCVGRLPAHTVMNCACESMCEMQVGILLSLFCESDSAGIRD